MVELLTENSFAVYAWLLFTVVIIILAIVNYRKKKYCESVISTLIGSEEAVFELYKEVIKLEKQDVKAHIIEIAEKDQVPEALKLAKAHVKITKAERKQAEELQMQDRRMESIIKLAQITRSQILKNLSKKK